MSTQSVEYHYVDVWSSIYTWGGSIAGQPVDGDFVVINEGQTVLLDTDTPVLKMLLIQGKIVHIVIKAELNHLKKHCIPKMKLALPITHNIFRIGQLKI